MKLEYKRMKLNTSKYYQILCVFCRLILCLTRTSIGLLYYLESKLRLGTKKSLQYFDLSCRKFPLEIGKLAPTARRTITSSSHLGLKNASKLKVEVN